MKALKIATVLPLLLLLSGALMAATQYGEATVEQGSMTIVREGRSLQFNTVNETVPVNEEDLIRVREDSRVVLKSRENATMTLGANAVFHVKPWRAKGKTGFVRALFGRFRATIAGLVGGEQFNVKTATATIGVKGTEYLSAITSRGSTMLITTEHDPDFTGQRGPPVDVQPGEMSLVININPPTPPAPVPPEVGQQFGINNLNAPPPNSRRGRNFPGERGLVRSGIVTDDDLDEGKGDGAGGGPPGGPPPNAPQIQFDPNAGSGATQIGNVRIRF